MRLDLSIYCGEICKSLVWEFAESIFDGLSFGLFLLVFRTFL